MQNEVIMHECKNLHSRIGLKFVNRKKSDQQCFAFTGSVYFDLEKYGRYGQLVSHSMDISMVDAG